MLDCKTDALIFLFPGLGSGFGVDDGVIWGQG